jgi:protein ImuB
MLWAALLPDPGLSDSQRTEAVRAHAVWCLQFTPRVSVAEPESESPAVVMEVAASARLFGGRRQLVERVKAQAAELGVGQLSWAPTSLGAVALARTGRSNGFARPLESLLDELPLAALNAVAAHAPTLARLGCRTLGQVRALPRGGLSRRFDKELLAALDRAYGLRPEVHTWVEIPETFCARLELMARVELAPALLFGARRLLLQLCAWLSARRSGVTACTLRWCHDAMRSKIAGDGGSLTIRTAEPTRNLEHLSRLLAEHLARLQLQAPVGDLQLEANEVHPLEEQSRSLLPDAREDGESLALVLERIAARLGPERVLRPVTTEDHRPEWMCQWQPAPEQRPRGAARPLEHPQPTFILPKPLRLALRDSQPLYQGALQLLAGPHRIEFGWWDRVGERPGEPVDPEAPCANAHRHVARDYWVALSEHAGVLWIFQTRLADERSAWFLHGIFA